MQTLLYKSIDEDLINSFSINVEKQEFFYKDDQGTNKLDLVEFENLDFPKYFSLEDSKEKWDYREHSCYLNLTLRCVGFNNLFGEICNQDAKLGLGLVWKTNNSKVKKCIKIGEFIYKKNQDITFTLNDILISDCSSSIDFYWTIYLIDYGNNQFSLPSYAKGKGMILGKDLLFSFMVDSNAKLFPIIPKSDPDGPLWGIYFNVVDPLSDSFSAENLYIYYNTEHPTYKKYFVKGPDFCEPFFKEFLESSVFALLLDLKQFYDNSGTYSYDAEADNDGSIQQTVNYLRSLGICFDKTNEELHKSVQLLLQKEKHLCD